MCDIHGILCHINASFPIKEYIHKTPNRRRETKGEGEQEQWKQNKENRDRMRKRLNEHQSTEYELKWKKITLSQQNDETNSEKNQDGQSEKEERKKVYRKSF